jgi:hypothetical protein
MNDINDLNVSGLIINPLEAYAPLVIDAKVVLPRPLSFQSLKMVAWGSKQVSKVFGVIQVDQFAASGALNVHGQLCR